MPRALRSSRSQQDKHKNCQLHTRYWRVQGMCDSACGKCVGGHCMQADGYCEKACVPGFYGPRCTTACPEFTVTAQGCHSVTGLPHACDANHYPGLDSKKTPLCLDCSATCVDQECSDDETCTKGCVEGFFGPSCDRTCPDNCDDGCDRN